MKPMLSDPCRNVMKSYGLCLILRMLVVLIIDLLCRLRRHPKPSSSMVAGIFWGYNNMPWHLLEMKPQNFVMSLVFLKQSGPLWSKVSVMVRMGVASRYFYPFGCFFSGITGHSSEKSSNRGFKKAFGKQGPQSD